jgi:hypothetical protein
MKLFNARNVDEYIPLPVTVKFGMTAASWLVTTTHGELNRFA